MKTKLLILFFLFSFVGISQEGKPLKVGEEIIKTYESSHPYNGSISEEFEKVSSHRIFEKYASYVAVHFE